MKIFKIAYLKRLYKILVATITGFLNDNGLKLSASLAYYTVFSIAPLLVLILGIISVFLKDPVNRDMLYVQIKQYVGADASLQIQDIIKHYGVHRQNAFAIGMGIIVLLIGASSMFIEIQDSLNTIWRVKAKPKKGWLKLIQNRFLSFSLIGSMGFLLLVTLVVNILISALSNKIQHFFPGVDVFIYLINLAISLVVITVLFGIIFKVLPDVKIKWKDVRSGAFFTALLFILGQYLIGLYIQYFGNSSAYGAAGSLIVILTWIYYTSAILYIGAEFTQVYAEASGSSIEPAEYAVAIKQTEVEIRGKKLPAQNPGLKSALKEDAGDTPAG